MPSQQRDEGLKKMIDRTMLRCLESRRRSLRVGLDYSSIGPVVPVLCSSWFSTVEVIKFLVLAKFF
jgi:hypothetical protein